MVKSLIDEQVKVILVKAVVDRFDWTDDFKFSIIKEIMELKDG